MAINYLERAEEDGVKRRYCVLGKLGSGPDV